MTESRGTRIVLLLATVGVLAFIYLPLVVIGIYAFNSSTNQAWPIPGLSLQWFEQALEQSGVREALWTSIVAGAHRHQHRAGARQPGSLRGAALPLLRA